MRDIDDFLNRLTDSQKAQIQVAAALGKRDPVDVAVELFEKATEFAQKERTSFFEAWSVEELARLRWFAEQCLGDEQWALTHEGEEMQEMLTPGEVIRLLNMIPDSPAAVEPPPRPLSDTDMAAYFPDYVPKSAEDEAAWNQHIAEQEDAFAEQYAAEHPDAIDRI